MRIRTLFIGIIAALLSGCATVFKGYESELVIYNAPRDLAVQSEDGVGLRPTFSTTTIKQYYKSYYGKSIIIPDSSSIKMNLRSGKEYLLILKSGEKVSRVRIYPKLGAWWLILDLFCGVIPAGIDMHLGTWMYYDPVDFKSIPEQ